jgi:hypothetical protein
MATHVIQFGDEEQFKQAIGVLLEVPVSRMGIPGLKIVVSDEHIEALKRAKIDYVDLTHETGGSAAPVDSGCLQEGQAAAGGRLFTTPIIPAEPICVVDLPLPPDLAELLAESIRTSGYTRSQRRAVEEDFKLNHHYAGHYILATSGPRGLEIHAIDLEGPDQAREHTERLRAQGYRNILSLFPRSWNDPNDAIVTLNSI